MSAHVIPVIVEDDLRARVEATKLAIVDRLPAHEVGIDQVLGPLTAVYGDPVPSAVTSSTIRRRTLQELPTNSE